MEMTKKEKRALAKESKQKDQKTHSLISKLKRYASYAAVIAFIIVGFWYLNKPTAPSTTVTDKFVEYAGELGMDTEKFKADMQSSEVTDKINIDIANGNQKSVNATPTFFLNGTKLENIRKYDDLKSYVVGASAGGAGDGVEILDTDHVAGNIESDVTLIEYSDFQCPACATFYPLVKQLKSELASDFRFVYRHYPLVTIHKNAYAASAATEAASMQGKFWEMHDLLFEKQSEWSNL